MIIKFCYIKNCPCTTTVIELPDDSKAVVAVKEIFEKICKSLLFRKLLNHNALPAVAALHSVRSLIENHA
jgi:hypothetical protein